MKGSTLIFVVVLAVFSIGCAVFDRAPANEGPKDGECRFFKKPERVPAFNNDQHHRYIQCYDAEDDRWVMFREVMPQRAPAIIEQKDNRAPASK